MSSTAMNSNLSKISPTSGSSKKSKPTSKKVNVPTKPAESPANVDQSQSDVWTSRASKSPRQAKTSLTADTTQIGTPNGSTTDDDEHAKRRRLAKQLVSQDSKVYFKVKGKQGVALIVAAITVVLLVALTIAYLIYCLTIDLQNMKTQLAAREKMPRRIAILNSSLDHTIDPCDDFYNHTCGNYRAVFADLGIATIHDLVQDEILELYMHAFRDKDGALVRKLTKNSKSIATVWNKIKECWQREKKMQNDHKTPEFWLEKNNLTNWPQTTPNDKISMEWFIDKYADMYMFGARPIFDVSVQTEEHDPTVKYIMFSPSALPPISTTSMAYIAQEIKHNTKDYSAQMNEIQKFQGKLLKNIYGPVTKLTLSQLKRKTGGKIDWTLLLNRIASQSNSKFSFSDTTSVLVTSLSFMVTASELLASTPAYIVHNYLGWSYLTTAMANGYIDFYGANKSRLMRMDFDKDFISACVESEIIGNMFASWSKNRHALSRIFLEAFISVYGRSRLDQIKSTATIMGEDIRQALRELIDSADWLDKLTKDYALEKLEAIDLRVAYDEWMFDYASIDQIDGYPQEEEEEVSHLPENAQRSVQAKAFNLYGEKGELPKRDSSIVSWTYATSYLNAMNFPNANRVFMYLGYLLQPLFDPDDPPSINYGSIGVMLGHEFSHAFDMWGSDYDKYGKIANWWTEKSRKNFKEKTQCFLDQYGAVVDPVSKIKLNSEKTLDEDIADNGGLKAAFRAYKKRQQTSGGSSRTLLSKSEFSQYTDDQLFFYAFGLGWCEAYDRFQAAYKINQDVHSLFKYRVNIPLQNFPQFSETFNCSIGSRMNPKEKCAVW